MWVGGLGVRDVETGAATDGDTVFRVGSLSKSIVALVMPEPEIAYRILALNTEKAHNLKDKALEVIRMARAIAADRVPSMILWGPPGSGNTTLANATSTNFGVSSRPTTTPR